MFPMLSRAVVLTSGGGGSPWLTRECEICEAARGRVSFTSAVCDYCSPTGLDALGTVEWRLIVLGNAQFLADEGVATDALASQADALRRDGATAIFIGVDGTVGGAFAIADPVKATTPEALAALKDRKSTRLNSSH